MTLREVLAQEHIENIHIEYRVTPPEDLFISTQTIFAGIAEYEDGELTSLDGDDYSLEDEILSFYYDEDKWLCVVMEGEWL